jgi:hypothetical protein
VPRLINQLADLSLVYAFAGEEKLVMSSTVDQVLNDGVFFAGDLPESDGVPGIAADATQVRGLQRDAGAATGAEIAPFRKPR